MRPATVAVILGSLTLGLVGAALTASAQFVSFTHPEASYVERLTTDEVKRLRAAKAELDSASKRYQAIFDELQAKYRPDNANVSGITYCSIHGEWIVCDYTGAVSQ